MSLSGIRTDPVARFRASGWDVQEIDGHDPPSHRRGHHGGQERNHLPSMIACKTHIALRRSSAQDASRRLGALTDPQADCRYQGVYGWTAGLRGTRRPSRSAWEAIGARGRHRRAPHGRHALPP
ncbi:MAG: hypothetical protein U5N10_14895 [Gemmobacter sp.]|nr:hypothetical protein [Gemmobacter sp.]